MSVENADDLPSAPALVRIEDEWIEYREKKESLFAIARRGARRTAATKHPAGAPVRYGDEIVFEIPLPAYRHQEE
ncbi:MAG: hypothetical protein A2Z34_12055 [Planctomycetes bacterium RBG_16_59_8]|nr:MAG: hypothetical protein A2Z34_12055 [Planctomycetes bacterium RBG_16_59_8]